VAPEGDSSSPRDDVIIDSIESRGAVRGVGREKTRIHLSDGSSFILLKEIVERAALTESDKLSRQALQDLLEQSDQLEAEGKALDLITRSPHSRERLKLKLLKKDFSLSSVNRALDRMEELGYLDDARFAEEWLRMRIARHPEGRRSLLAGLLNRGINSSLAGELVNRIVTREVEEDCAKRLMEKHSVFGSLPRDKLARRLSSRGFSPSVIRQLIEETAADD
jgi:regulatory protein